MFADVRRVSVWLVTLLIAVSLLDQVMIYKVGIIASKYYKVFGDRDRDGFVLHTTMAVLLIGGHAFITATVEYIGQILGLAFQLDICTSIHSLYFTGNTYYKMNVVEKVIDNPDQRISTDVQVFSRTFVRVITPAIITPFTIIYYTYQAAIATGYIGPVSCLAFFVFFAVLNKILLSPVVNSVFKGEQCQADFRFRHTQVRVYAESAAFSQAGLIENNLANAYLQRLINTRHGVMARKYAVFLCTSFAKYLGQILSYLSIATPIFAGVYDSLSPSSLSQLISKQQEPNADDHHRGKNAFVFLYLLECLTKLIHIANSISNMAGSTHRVGEMLEHIADLKGDSRLFRNKKPPSDHTGDVKECLPSGNAGIKMTAMSDIREISYGEPAILFHSVTYTPPKSNTILCRNLDLTICRGKNLLITGESGSGKSSLLRILSSIWSPRSGTVERRVALGPDGVMFLPQIPYFIYGNLYEQIVYPLLKIPPTDTIDETITTYLKLMDMSHLVERFGGLRGKKSSWSDQLSPGEIQRLLFVRLFYHKPLFAVLDEATSQISEEKQLLMYEKCRDLDITLISVGRDPNLRRHHHLNLHLTGSGEWSLQSIPADLDQLKFSNEPIF